MIRLAKFASAVAVMLLLIAPADLQSAEKSDATTTLDAHIGNLNALAESGKIGAQLALASLYEYRKQNYIQAVKWYRKAAEQKHGYAMFILGKMYESGRGVGLSNVEAANWYRKAAEQGYQDAFYSLAHLYESSGNGEKDIAEAIIWYRRAAEQGDAFAQMYLGQKYRIGQGVPLGWGVPQDSAEALKWYRRAADQGDWVALSNLGSMHEEGDGTPRDYAEAIKWYNKAADEGDGCSLPNVGRMYYNGTGVQQSYAEAAKWYRKAVRHGCDSARDRLRKMYQQGLITPEDNAEASWLARNGPVEIPPEAKAAEMRGDYVEAAKWYRQAAEQGHGYAQLTLGEMYYRGEGVRQDFAEAAKWIRRAADQGIDSARTILGGMYYRGQGVPQSHEEAAKWMRRAADRLYPEAMFNLGVMYHEGTGVPQDDIKAIHWTRKAADYGFSSAEQNLGTVEIYGNTSTAITPRDAENVNSSTDKQNSIGELTKRAEDGDAVAQLKLGDIYRKGIGVTQNFSEAIHWYRMAADQGEAEAQFRLGVRYGLGQGVPKDNAEENRWYRKAAEQGHPEAQYLLGYNYFEGRGVGKNLTEAAKWFRKAAEQEHGEAQTSLGNMYRYGQGVPENLVEAAHWYRKAADLGDAKGQFYLGMIYESKGASQNYAEAIRWYRKAADQGEVRAQAALGLAYKFGKGVKKDYVTAYAWSVLGMSKSNNLSSVDELREYDLLQKVATGVRDDLAREMTPQQVAKAEKLAQAWKSKGQAAEPSSAPKATPVLTKAETAPKSVKGEAPVIALQPIPATTAQTVDVIGRASSKGRITALQIDGTDVSVRADGLFSMRRGIPLGESEIKVVATDEWGRSSEARIAVNRTVASTETAYPPLRSNLIHGKPRPDAVVLIIGVEQYKSVPQADFAENDAKTFYDFAINALGVPASRVKLLTGQNAQKVDVDAAILTWLKPLVAAGKTDVFVYFSGHGLASDDGKELFLLPQDGNRALLDRSAIRRSELIDMVISSGAKSAMFFIDACYSGGTRGTESLVASARPVLLTAKEQSVPPNVTILAAAANDQLSSALGQAKHGLFSYFLMRGLSGEAAAGDRTVTAGELAAYLAERVPPEAARLGRSQTPQLVGDGSKVIATW